MTPGAMGRDHHILGTNPPLVSVIIPTFNSGPWLGQAIESALAQTYPSIEIVVVNDGSTDPRTRETALTYVPRITYIERENGGVAAARNAGIEISNGELIALLDQDDVWLPHKLEAEVNAWSAHAGVALIHSSYHLINERGERLSTSGDQKWLTRLKDGEYKPLPDLLLHVPICAATTLFPRRLLQEVGMFDPTLSGTDDWDLWLRMAAHGYTFYCVGEPLVEYRTHPHNTSRDIDLMVGGVLRTLDKFYAQTNIPENALLVRDRAYFNKHTWAASLYYGAGNLAKAQNHLQAAIRRFPQGITTGRFLQSLIHANHQAGGPPPGSSDIDQAAHFLRRSIGQAGLPSATRRAMLRKITARIKLLHALQSGRPAQLASALMYDPALVVDREVWSALRRKSAVILSRLPIGTPTTTAPR